MNATTVDALFQQTGVNYDVVPRKDVRPSRDARPSHVPRGLIAKTVVVADDGGYALAVMPKSRRIDLGAINLEFGRGFTMVNRDVIRSLFPDLPTRAIPPIGLTQGIETFVDQALVSLNVVYFETEDPRRLLRLDGEDFRELFYGAWCGRISESIDGLRAEPGAVTRKGLSNQ